MVIRGKQFAQATKLRIRRKKRTTTLEIARAAGEAAGAFESSENPCNRFDIGHNKFLETMGIPDTSRGQLRESVSNISQPPADTRAANYVREIYLV